MANDDTDTSTSTPEAEVDEQEERPRGAIDRAFLYDVAEAGELVLVRHGEQAWPDPKTSTTGDWIDPPLSEVGRRQIEAVGKHLAAETITAVYSSPLARAFDTANAIAQHHGLEPLVFDDLREVELFGKVHPQSRAEDVVGKVVIEGARERFVLERRWDVYPMSESSAEVRERVSRIVEGIASSHVGQRVVIACHAGVINAYLVGLLGVRQDMFFRPNHTSVSRVRFYDTHRVIYSLNETHHLGEPDLFTA